MLFKLFRRRRNQFATEKAIIHALDSGLAECLVPILSYSYRYRLTGSVKSSNGLARSHRLRGLPSSSGSPSQLPLRARRGRTGNKSAGYPAQPSRRAIDSSSLACCQHGFYSGQPTSYPASRPWHSGLAPTYRPFTGVHPTTAYPNTSRPRENNHSGQ